MFSEKFKEQRDRRHRRNEVMRLMRTERDAHKRQQLFDELQEHHSRLAELDTIPDTHTCLACGGSYSAVGRNLKFSIRALVVCDETGRPVEQVDYRPVRMGGICSGCAERVKAYLEAQE